MRVLALAVRFGLELVALVAVTYGGSRVDGPVALRVLFALASLAAAVLIWGRWVAPRAPRKLPDPLRLLPEWGVFGGATAALVLTGHPGWGIGLAVLAAGDRLALWLLGVDTGGQDAPAPTDGRG